MPAPANVAEFLDVVRKSGLIPEDRLQTELHRLRITASTNLSVDQVAVSFIENALLTRFQSKQMKLGRYKRFEIASKYRLLELLGVGGMGAVYLCEHMFMKRLVALKVLPVEKLQDPSALLRFYREARAVAALDHPNIVRAYDIDKFEQMHFLVMEYVDGASIQEVVARHGPLDPMRAANYVAQSAHGLHHAHQLGMVHRDVKPGNLLLERTGFIKILDMGLARFFDQKNDNVTERFDNNCVLGTADYLAPEQAVSNVVDIRADIYALGGSFYFMLTGQTPFPDGTIAHKLLCHQNEEPKSVRTFRSDVPGELIQILIKMMKKNPADRYQTPQELFDALSAIVDEAAVPPPIHEMPELCPAVLLLTGHAGDKARASSSRLSPNRGSVGSLLSKPLSNDPSGVLLQDHSFGGSSSAMGQAQVATGRASNTLPIPSQQPLNTVSRSMGESEVDLLSPPRSATRPGQQSALGSHQYSVLVGLVGGLVIAAAFAIVALLFWLKLR